MSASRDAVLMLDHSAELGGGELSLLDYAKSTVSPVYVIVFEDGPFVELLRRNDVTVDVLLAGGLLSARRSHSLLRSLILLPGLAWFVIKLSKRMRTAGIVYANSQKALVTACLANITARRPLVWHLHDIMTAAHFSRTMRRVAIGLANRFATHVITNSAATKISYHAAGGRLPVTVVHNGIDAAPFERTDAAKARVGLLAETGILGDVPIVALFGRLSSWKGQDIAIRAIRALPNVHLVLIGAALFGDAAFDTTLRALVCEMGLEGRVHFLGFRHDGPELMAAVDIVVHCSTAPEPFGRVIVEAMMAGTPVVATAAGGALEIVEDGRTGILVPPGNVAALTSAIAALISHPEQSMTMATAAHADAIRRFSLAAAVDRTDAVLHAIANRSPTNGVRS